MFIDIKTLFFYNCLSSFLLRIFFLIFVQHVITEGNCRMFKMLSPAEIVLVENEMRKVEFLLHQEYNLLSNYRRN